MAITPNKSAIEAAGLEYIEPHEIVKDTGPKALNLLAQAVVDIQAKPSAAKPTIITSSTYRITTAGDYVAGVATTLTLDNGQSLPMQRGQAIVAVDVSGQLFYSDFITLAGPKPPTLTPGTLSATATQTEITATVTGAKDSESGLHAAPYRFSRDGGTSWTPWQAGSSYTFSGLTAGVLYNLLVEVRNIAGDVAQLSLTKSTQEDPNAWGTLYFDDFNDAPDGSIAGRPIGNTTWEVGVVANHKLAGNFRLPIAYDRIRFDADWVPQTSSPASNFYFGWDGSTTGTGEAPAECWRVHLSRGSGASLYYMDGSASGTQLATSDGSNGGAGLGSPSKITFEVDAGLFTVSIKGNEIMRHQVADWHSGAVFSGSVGSGHTFDNFALRVA